MLSTNAHARLRRWEDALERGPLSIEEAAQRIKQVRSEIDGFAKTRDRLEQQNRLKTDVLPIPTALMDTYVRAMQARLEAKKIGYNRAFLTDLVKEVKIDGDEARLTHRLPFGDGGGPKTEVFTVCQIGGGVGNYTSCTTT